MIRMKTYAIQFVSELTGLSASTLRRYEKKYPHILAPHRVVTGKKSYRIYTWKDIEMLIYVKQKMDEGYSADQAWESFFNFDVVRYGAAKMLDEERSLIQSDVKMWVPEDSTTQVES